MRDKAEANGYRACELIDAATVYTMLPHLGPGALGGMTVPDESIICTWTVNLALATDAVNRGATLLTGRRVQGMQTGPEATTLRTDAGPVTARWVVNAAGLGADLVDGLFGHSRVHRHPASRRTDRLRQAGPAPGGQDRAAGSHRGRQGSPGQPTIYGNVMLGPTAEDLENRTATGTTQSGFDFLLDKGRALMPRLLDEEITATYAGLRASIDHGDYLIEADPAQRYLLVGGIRSTGLTAGMAIAEHVRGQLESAGCAMTAAPICPTRRGCPTWARRSHGRTKRAAASCASANGSPKEIRDACGSTIPPAALDGLRRRTRVMNGRCQGFYCGAEVQELFDRGDRDERRRRAIVGAGPAGLAAATKLSRETTLNVVVLERESEAGGTPARDHPGYGIRDFRTFISGPAYARRLTADAVAAGVDIRTDTMVTGWAEDTTLEVTSPQGRERLEARAVILATGARERPRSARLIPGDRGEGVYTTGHLQNIVHLKGGKVGTRAVVIGAELVGLLGGAHPQEGRLRHRVDDHPARHRESYGIFNLFARTPLLGVRIATRTRLCRIIGKPRVTGVELEHLDTAGKRGMRRVRHRRAHRRLDPGP